MLADFGFCISGGAFLEQLSTSTKGALITDALLYELFEVKRVSVAVVMLG